MSEKTGAEILAELIGAWKCNPVFHVPGEGMLEILDALARQGRPQLISCRHEAGMTFMADATARFGDEPGLCIVGRAPGALNTCLAVHTAHTDAVPLIVLIGQASAGTAEREAFLNIGDFHRTFGAMTKWVAEINDARRIPEMMSRAFHTAMSGRRGPVVLVVPENVLRQKATVPVLPSPPAAVRLSISPQDLEQIAGAVAGAQKPMILLGGTGWTAQSCRDLAIFAERQEIPVAVAYRRRDLIDNDHPCYAGELGIGVDQALVRRVNESDLLLVLEMRLGELNTIGAGVFEGFTLMNPADPQQTIIHVHSDITELNRVYRAAAAINATPPETAAQLASIPAPPGSDRQSSWRQAARRDREAFVSGGVCPGPLDLKAVFMHLRARLDEDAIVTSGAGGYALWPQRYFSHKVFGTQAGPKSGAMGFGLPAAIGLQLMHPDRQVLAVAGDGCFLMTGEELATAVRSRVPVVILVVNNQMYGAIQLAQTRMFGRSEGVDLASPDLAAYARSFGAFGERVERTEEFPVVLGRALAAEKPALIELIVTSGIVKPGSA